MGNLGNSQSSLAKRRRSGEGREKGLSGLPHKAVFSVCVCACVSVCEDRTDTRESRG